MVEILCEKRIYSDKVKSHQHDYGQLIIPLDGALHLTTSKRSFSVGDRAICYVPKSCIHEYNAVGENLFLVTDVSSDLLKRHYQLNDDNIKLKQIMDKRWQAIRNLMLVESETGDKASLMRLFEYVVSFLDFEEEIKSITYMKANLNQKIDFKDLAAIENYNFTYYSEWFKKKTGCYPKAYLQNLRLEEAKRLLRETELNIIEIAFEIGYDQQSSFSRFFKQMMGITAKQYRSQRNDKLFKDLGN